MSLTACRECGTAVPANAHACPKCGASLAPVSYAAYRPAPRPPAPPERPWWRTASGWGNAAGWMVIAGACVLFGLFAVRASAAGDRREVEEAEMAREEEHMRRVNAWVQDTLATATLSDSAGRPVPTSARARRMWVTSRMRVERRVWEREIMERHGVKRSMSLDEWLTPRYQADAREYPAVGRYVEGRVAAIAEIEKTFPAWMEARTAALARESGMPAAEIRGLFPPDFGATAMDEARLAGVMLEFHRHFVRVDPRVHHAGGKNLRFEREDDVRAGSALVKTLNDAIAASDRTRESRLAREQAALARAIEA